MRPHHKVIFRLNDVQHKCVYGLWAKDCSRTYTKPLRWLAISKKHEARQRPGLREGESSKRYRTEKIGYTNFTIRVPEFTFSNELLYRIS